MSEVTMTQEVGRYELQDVEGFIANLSISREAQHLMNEILWAYDYSPECFLRLSGASMFDVISRSLKTVRREAGNPQVANELWYGLSQKWSLEPLGDVARPRGRRVAQ